MRLLCCLPDLRRVALTAAHFGCPRSDKTQGEWVKAFITALEELKKYVMKFHTTGVAWNPKVSI